MMSKHYSSKRSVNWVGYKAYDWDLDENNPGSLQMYTTLSTITDEQAVEPIHEILSEKTYCQKDI